MRWAVEGADRTTGADVRTEVEAATEADAVKAVGREMFVASVRRLAPRPPPPVLPYQGGPEPVTVPPPTSTRGGPSALTIIGLSGVGVLALVGLLALVMWSRSSTPAQVAAPRLPVAMPPAPFSPAPASLIDLNVERAWFDRRGSVRSVAFRIRNNSQTPIVVRSVRFNGEFLAWRGEEYESSYAPSRQPWPVTLTIGQKVLVFQNDPANAYPANYPKDVLYVEVFTDLGPARFDFPN